MKFDQELKIQAYLDGELSPRESREVQAWLATDSEAQALLTELKLTRSTLVGNEPEAKLPESREFFWSKIERQIEAEAPAEAAARIPFWLAWRRYFAPVAGVAIVAVLAVFSIRVVDVPEDANSHLAEVENLSEHSSSISFRSQSENMFVVWVSPKDQPSEDAESEDDIVIQ
jgi:anti-sigma factor RsiW